MKIFKKILSLIVVSILLLHSIENTAYAIPDIPSKKPIKVGVFLADLSNVFNSALERNLEELQKQNEDKIQFTVFDSKASQATENENIARELNSDFDLFVVAPVSSNETEINEALNKIIIAELPLIIYFPTIPSLTNIAKSYSKSVIIDGDNNQGGALEGKILSDAWNAHKNTLDKNKDNIMQYVMLQGPSNNLLTLSRSKYAIRSLNEAGVKTDQLLSIVCNWQKDCAETAIESASLTLNGKIEAIISNNDNMAIGAIEALQKYGYNKNDSSKYIPIVGIGGVPESIELIKQGAMLGTAVQDTNLHAQAIYTVGMNLVSANDPLSGTNFKFDETGTTIKLPYYEGVK